MKTTIKIKPLFRGLGLCLILFLLLASCKDKPMGYGVLLWLDGGTETETTSVSSGESRLSLQEGQVYPVYSESNLRNSYTLTPAKTGEVAIERWRLEFFASEKDAQGFASSYIPYLNLYAETLRSGQAIRAEADSSAERIYRLRTGQLVKILDKLPQEVTEGSLTDYWYRVLTEDGTKGYCFGGNLDVFDREERQNQGARIEVDPALENFLSKPFYPDEFQKMIQERRINLKVMSPQVGTFPNLRDNKILVVTPEKTLSFSFEAILPREAGRYTFGDSGLEVTIVNTNRVSLRYEDGPATVTQGYTAIDNISGVIEEELLRQEQLLEEFYYMGPVTSSAYGTISFESRGAFVWENYNRLVPSVIPQGAGSMGKIELFYYPHSSLRSQYQGVLSFRFNSQPEPVSFLYNKTEQGLRMVYVPPRDIQDGLVARVAASPTVVFFSADNPRPRPLDED